MHINSKWIFLLFASLVTGFAGFAQQSSLKVLSYNVLHGFNDDSIKIREYIDWVKNANPDVIAYQELNGFELEDLEKLAASYGHAYAVINTGVTHPIGITSRYPIVMVHKVTTNFWHSYLYGNINGIHIFVTHLSPFDVKSRRNDIDMILAHARLLPQNEKIMIAGDLNSLAATDSSNYGASLLNAMRKSEGRLEPKSGLPIVKGKTIYRNNLDNGNIDYTVTGKFITAGFKDAFYITNKYFKHSAPTKGHASKNSKLRRIDYIWVNNALAKQVVSADIIQDKTTDNLSDHYPVLLEFRQ